MSKKLKKRINLIYAAGVFVFAIFAVFGLSLLTGNQQDSGVDTSSASAQEPADINSDNVVDIVDLSILLSNWSTTDNLSDINNDNIVDIVDLSILLSKWGDVTITPPSGNELYGPAFNMDSLSNMQVGGNSSASAPNVLVSYRFRAEQSSALIAFRAFWLGTQYSPGYAGGTGGTIRCTIELDSGGIPSGEPLATYDYAPGASPLFPNLSFPSPATLTEGQLYHLVFTNIDPAPRENFVSVDLGYMFNSTSPRQPKYPDSDYAALRRWPTTAWTVQDGYTPIIDFTYGNGKHQGQGYKRVTLDPAVISGDSNFVRERFTVSGGDRTISSAAVRIAKTSGSGNLVVSLEDQDGNTIDSFSASTYSVPYLASNDDSAGVWVSGSFSGQNTLVNGQTYNLRLSTDNSTSLWTRGIERGSADGFNEVTYFNDGGNTAGLQATTNGGASWGVVPNLGNRGDMQFYLY